MTEPDELQRLRRQLRAMAALNEQLRAQLEAVGAESGPTRGTDPLQDPAVAPAPVGAAPRRGRRALDWVAEATADGPSDGSDAAFLVSRPDDGIYLVDGGRRRRVRSGLLVPALEQLLGERRSADDDAFTAWPEGPPVEVLEGPVGPPFVLVGGRRLTVTGLPLPHPVAPEVADRLAPGPSLDLVAGLAPRRGGEAAGWSTPVVAAAPGSTRARLVVADSGTWVVEGSTRRPVSSGLLVPALEQLLGERRPIAADELDVLAPGPPVAVLEGAIGAPFVVVEGRRLPVRGLPLPYPVVTSATDRLPEGPPLDLVRATAARRANEAVGWLGAGSAGSRDLALVVDPDQGTWLIEGDRRRRVASTLLVVALEQLAGSRRRVEADELATWTEGEPVEVLEGRTGPPFVLVGGVRHPLRSLPVPFPVDESTATRLPEGPTLDVVRAVAARRAERAVGWLDELARGAAGPAPVLIVGPDRSTWVLEGTVRRPVRAGLLLPILEDLLGRRRDATEEELNGPEGTPVEVLESRTGPPFVVIAGVRHPLRSLPVPVPVDEVGATRLPEGAELDVALLTRQLQEARRREAERQENPDPVGEIKSYLVKKRPR